MTSKEAIQNIKDFKIAITDDILISPIAEFYKEQVSIIERDLARLNEITKILTDMMEDDSVGCLNYKLEDYLTKIEEWLKNE